MISVSAQLEGFFGVTSRNEAYEYFGYEQDDQSQQILQELLHFCFDQVVVFDSDELTYSSLKDIAEELSDIEDSEVNSRTNQLLQEINSLDEKRVILERRLAILELPFSKMYKVAVEETIEQKQQKEKLQEHSLALVRALKMLSNDLLEVRKNRSEEDRVNPEEFHGSLRLWIDIVKKGSITPNLNPRYKEVSSFINSKITAEIRVVQEKIRKITKFVGYADRGQFSSLMRALEAIEVREQLSEIDLEIGMKLSQLEQ